jgi:hypothetical protein
MFYGHHFILAVFFTILGYGAAIYRERRKAPRKRGRAIPRGTATEKAPRKPRSPRKAKREPEEGTPLAQLEPETSSRP